MTDLSQNGPGLMLDAIQNRNDSKILATVEIIVQINADILVLGGLDWDHAQLGLQAFNALLSENGLVYGYAAFPKPVSGINSHMDLDGDQRLNEPEDALGYGAFTGQNGVAVLSRYPVTNVQDHHRVLWKDWGTLEGLVPDDAISILPLVSVGMFEVAVQGLTLLVFVNIPPVFDGPEDRNGLRNSAQIAFIRDRLEHIPNPVLIGRANLDPIDGEGRHQAIASLLSHPLLQDPQSQSKGGREATNPNAHQGNPALDTANWQQGPGPLRVDYILPSQNLDIVQSGIFWPKPSEPFGTTVADAGTGRLVWVDLTLPQTGDTSQ